MLMLDTSHLKRSAAYGRRWHENQLHASELRDHIDHLEMQLGELQLENNEIAEATGEEERFANRHLVALGQADCRELCEALYDKLPRELRDMVYNYIVDACMDTTVRIGVFPQECIAAWDRHVFYPAPHNCVHGICASHFLNKAYVGAIVQQEIAEMWLATRSFLFSFGWRDLLGLLISDRWLTGQPAHRSISHIIIHVSSYAMKYGEDIDMLEALTLLKPSAQVTLHFDLRNDYCGKRDVLEKFQSTISELWPSIERFDQSRLRIDVGIEGPDGEAMIRLAGGASLHGWSKVLEEVSLKCACKMTAGLIEFSMRCTSNFHKVFLRHAAKMGR